MKTTTTALFCRPGLLSLLSLFLLSTSILPSLVEGKPPPPPPFPYISGKDTPRGRDLPVPFTYDQWRSTNTMPINYKNPLLQQLKTTILNSDILDISYIERRLAKSIDEKDDIAVRDLLTCPACKDCVTPDTLATLACDHVMHAECLRKGGDACVRCKREGPHGDTGRYTNFKGVAKILEGERRIPVAPTVPRNPVDAYVKEAEREGDRLKLMGLGYSPEDNKERKRLAEKARRYRLMSMEGKKNQEGSSGSNPRRGRNGNNGRSRTGGEGGTGVKRKESDTWNTLDLDNLSGWRSKRRTDGLGGKYGPGRDPSENPTVPDPIAISSDSEGENPPVMRTEVPAPGAEEARTKDADEPDFQSFLNNLLDVMENDNHRADTRTNPSADIPAYHHAPSPSNAHSQASADVSGYYNTPSNPSADVSGYYNAPSNPSADVSGYYNAPSNPSADVSGYYNAPSNPSAVGAPSEAEKSEPRTTVRPRTHWSPADFLAFRFRANLILWRNSVNSFADALSDLPSTSTTSTPPILAIHFTEMLTPIANLRGYCRRANLLAQVASLPVPTPTTPLAPFLRRFSAAVYDTYNNWYQIHFASVYRRGHIRMDSVGFEAVLALQLDLLSTIDTLVLVNNRLKETGRALDQAKGISKVFKAHSAALGDAAAMVPYEGDNEGRRVFEDSFMMSDRNTGAKFDWLEVSITPL